MKENVKILFILKRREDYNHVLHCTVNLSTGLFNSANYMHEMLLECGFDSNIVVVVDNNDIDREVTKYRPTHVIIEALWVVPSKFDILQRLHPTVKWIIRLHSDMPFMAGEGMAMNWIAEYSEYRNLIIACNSPKMLLECKKYTKVKNDSSDKVIYLPNYYPPNFATKKFQYDSEYINIGCFGAIRPLKNHLLQAVAALTFADLIGKKLRFHINTGRIEMKGDSVFNNLKGMFEQLSDTGHEMIHHYWMPRENFLEICAEMDIGMQVSFSETFNIVAADLLSQGIPVIGSKEIPWLSNWAVCDSTDNNSIVRKLLSTYNFPWFNTWLNKRKLTKYVTNTKQIWTEYFINET